MDFPFLRTSCRQTGLETIIVPIEQNKKATITSEKEAIRMFKWFQSLVNLRYQELSQLRRELRCEADK